MPRSHSFSHDATDITPADDLRLRFENKAKMPEDDIEVPEDVSLVASPRRTKNKVTILEPPPPKTDNFNKWLLAIVLVAVAAGAAWVAVDARYLDTLMSAFQSVRQTGADVKSWLSSELQQQAETSELPDSVRKQLEEAEKIREELDRMKSLELEHQRTLEQAEKLKRERDEALAKARAEEEQRAHDAELAKQAAEKAKAAAAALAAEKAAQESRGQEELSRQRKQEKLRREQQAREREQQRLEQEARRLERVRLEQQARELELKLQEQAARERELAEQQQRLAMEKEQREEREREAQAGAEQARKLQAEKEKNAGFSSDPCSGPTAKFVSNCRK